MNERRLLRRSRGALCVAVVGLAGLAASSGLAGPPPPLPGPASAVTPPGVVTVAHAATSQGSVAIRLYRARYLGHAVLCIQQVPQGNGQCASYPIGPTSKYARSSGPPRLRRADDGARHDHSPKQSRRHGILHLSGVRRSSTRDPRLLRRTQPRHHELTAQPGAASQSARCRVIIRPACVAWLARGFKACLRLVDAPTNVIPAAQLQR
jgi:hypothetical protein